MEGQARKGRGRANGGWVEFIHQGLHIEGSPPGKKGGRADWAVGRGEGDPGGEGCSWDML